MRPARRTGAVAAPRHCDLCGGETVEIDVAGGEDRLALIGENSARHFSRDALIPLERANACLNCGYVRFYVDPARLRRRVARGERIMPE